MMSNQEYLIIQLPSGFAVNGRVIPQPDGSMVIEWETGYTTTCSAERWLRICAQSIDLRTKAHAETDDNLMTESETP